MEKMKMKMNQEGLEVLMLFKHDNGINPSLTVHPISYGEYMETVQIPKSAFISGEEEKSVQAIHKTLNTKFVFTFSLEDSRRIYSAATKLLKNGLVNQPSKMTFNEVITSLFAVYKSNKWDGKDLEDGDLCTETYIRFKKGDTEPYFCIPWKEADDLLTTIGSGWKKKAFKNIAEDICELWQGNDTKFHRGLYQLPSQHEEWSLRIRMTTEFFSEDDIKKAKKKGEH